MAKRKLPFDCVVFAGQPEEVANPFTGDSCILEPDAVAVYDCIMGAQMVGDYSMLRKGLDWFRRHFPREYMILLD